MTVAIVSPTAAPQRRSPVGLQRLMAVCRLHAVSWPLLLVAPAAILAVTFAINLTIFALIDSEGEIHGTGAVLALYGFVVAFYTQAMTQTYPFALGLSVTRRQFFAATTVVAVLQSIAFATVLQALSVIEAATGGWGVDMRMFGVLRYVTDSAVLQSVTLFASLLLTTAIAMLLGAVYQRWRTPGFLIAGIGTIGLLGLTAVVVTWARWWPAIGSWFVDAPRWLVFVGVPLAAAVAAIAATWSVLRRATT
ncbi:ABC transporter permease [Rhodococcus sp. PAM 2766]|uniref:ABC transporter permease n=1 Tax=Rhodococcus parequi TaxID=3137122 RepID=A0ABW9FL98_9NOCA